MNFSAVLLFLIAVFKQNQVLCETVRCIEILQTCCLIRQAVNLTENENLEISPISSPHKLTMFEMKPPSILIRFPGLIFNSFPNLVEVKLNRAGIESLTQNVFLHASNLQDLYLLRNKLNIIESSTFIHAPELRALNLARNQINEIQDDAFQGLKKLRRLHLHGNKIRVLQKDTFNNLVSLEYLYLHSNEIATIESGALHLPRLEQLFMRNNKLSALSDDIFPQFPALIIVQFSNNKLTSIGEAFVNCHKLYTLDLSDNDQLENIELHKFAKLSALVGLFLDNVGLSVLDDKPTADTSVKSSLTKLHLARNHLSDLNIFYKLSVFPELEEVYLYKNNITRLGNVNFIQKYLPKLQKLYIDNNSFVNEWYNENADELNSSRITVQLVKPDEDFSFKL